MSTYDPVTPDPIHRVKPRREKIAVWLCVLLIAAGILPFIVDLPRTVMIIMAFLAVMTVGVIAALLLWPEQRAEIREEEQEYAPPRGLAGRCEHGVPMLDECPQCGVYPS